MDPAADKTQLLQAAMGGESGGIDELLGGDDSSKTSAIKKALEKMGGPQNGIMNQMLKSAGISPEDISNMDLMEEVEKVKHAGTNRQKEMDKLIEEIEKAAQATPE